jgi:hypothetical protein
MEKLPAGHMKSRFHSNIKGRKCRRWRRLAQERGVNFLQIVLVSLNKDNFNQDMAFLA